MNKFLKSVAFILISLTSVITLEAYNTEDVFFFVVPKGYTMHQLSKQLEVKTDTLYKYNPNLRNGLSAGIQIYLPATSVSEENIKKVDATPTFASGALKSVYEYAQSESSKQISTPSVNSTYSSTPPTFDNLRTSTQEQPQYNSEQVKQPIEESSYQPVLDVNGWFIDPTSKDVVYLSIPLKIKGDKIIGYSTPFTHEKIECNIPYHQMTTQEKSQMKLFDSKGRSYELYVGDCQYKAQVGKLTVYFADRGFNDNSVYTVADVSREAYISPAAAHEHRRINSIEKYVKSKIGSTIIADNDNPNPWGEMVISFIVYRDGKIGDVKILKSPDKSLNNDVIRSIKGINTDRSIKIEPAQIDKQYPTCIVAEDVDCQYQITLKVKPRMSSSQQLDAYKQYWDNYFSKCKEDIDYARKNLSSKRQGISNFEIPSSLKDLNIFINEFPLTKVIQGTNSDLDWSDGILTKWEKVVEKTFKSKNRSKNENMNSEVSIDGMYLKNSSDNQAATFLLNKLNDMIYFRIIENAVAEKIGNRNFYVPQSLNDIIVFYSKDKAKVDFKNYFERVFNKRVADLNTDANFRKHYSEWEESYYLSELGKLRNIILNKDKTKIIGDYKFVEQWYPYPNGSTANREIQFNNKRSYMLYPLQKSSRNSYRWGNRVVISTNRY